MTADSLATPAASSGLRARVRAGVFGVCAAGVLAAHNFVVNTMVPRDIHIPGRALTAAALLAIARAARLSAEELGIARATAWAGLRTGLVGSAVAGGSVAVAAVVPMGAEVLAAERFMDVAPTGALFDVLVDIPATALFEEWAFRGVLLALLLRVWPVKTAAIVSSVLFGVWHVLPSLDQVQAAGLSGAGAVAAVTGIVAATTVAGGVFAWLRLRWNSLLAPVLAHAAVNAAGYAAGWLLTHAF